MNKVAIEVLLLKGNICGIVSAMKKQVNVNLNIEKLPEGYYLATSFDVPGLVVQAKTIEEVVEIARDAIPYLLKKQKVSELPKQIISYPLALSV